MSALGWAVTVGAIALVFFVAWKLLSWILGAAQKGHESGPIIDELEDEREQEAESSAAARRPDLDRDQHHDFIDSL